MPCWTANGRDRMPDEPGDGRLVAEDRLLTLRDAAGRAAGDDRKRMVQAERGIDGLVRPLTILSDVVQDSTEALGGSSSAVDRLTTTLALAGRRRASRDGISALADLGRRDELGKELGSASSGLDLVDLDHIGLLGLGAAYAAVARPEAADLIDRGLRVALGDLMALDLLWELTPGVLG